MASSSADETVKVVVRVRPLSRKEVQDGHAALTTADERTGTIECRNPKADPDDPPKTFTFDAVFAPTVTQRHIYEVCAANVVEGCLQGFNGTIFAYGQTGAGKTFTMEGANDPPDLRGIIPNSFQHIFDKVALAETGQFFMIRASYLEIYNEEIRDLLSKDPKNRLELKENMDTGVYVKDLTSFVVKSAIEIDQVMQAGKKNRSVGSTLMNQASSRSHSIFTIVCECQTERANGDQHLTAGKLNLVDLAGSERQSKTGATGDRLKEATKINLSLSALGNVISALVDGKSQHIPYRDSKLTRLLQDSLGGNTKTVMCANCGPAGYNYDETVSTLRYANRAKNIKNKPRINEDPKDAMLREFQEEINRLKAQIANGEGGGGGGGGGEYGGGGVGRVEERIVEKIVEVEKVVEVKVGPSDEEMREIEEKARKERDALRQQAAADMQQLMEQHSHTSKERKQLEDKLLAEQESRERELEAQKKLKLRLKAMEAKLIQGGQMMDLAQKQEAELRQAQRELEEKHEKEKQMLREVALKEEAALAIEEQYSTLQEEVEIKTKKLKKLWSKYKEMETELRDQMEEFQGQKEEHLDTIRNLDRQLKLKDLIIANFVPADEVAKLERRAVWSDENEAWQLPRLDMAGRQLRPRRHMSANGLRRPETEFARNRKQFDSNPRFRGDNIVNFDLDPADRTIQTYEGPDMVSRVSHILDNQIGSDEQEITPTAVETGLGNPYQHYSPEEADKAAHEGVVKERKERPKSSSRRSSDKSKRSSDKSSRPRTAVRRRREDEDEA